MIMGWEPAIPFGTAKQCLNSAKSSWKVFAGALEAIASGRAANSAQLTTAKADKDGRALLQNDSMR